ncbi:MAG: long-chain acyl-CoA synthetase, partial [Bacteroidia bacterium]
MSNYLWHKSYPSFVPETVDVEIYTSVVDIYNQSITKYGNKVAYKNMDKDLTFNELDVQVNALVWYIQNKTNLKKGDRIALQMPNLLQFPVAIFACLKAGLVLVNTNPLYTSSEMLHQYKDSGAKAIIILENFACNLQPILDQTDIETVIVSRIGDMLGGLKGGIVNFVVKNIKKMVPAYQLP